MNILLSNFCPFVLPELYSNYSVLYFPYLTTVLTVQSQLVVYVQSQIPHQHFFQTSETLVISPSGGASAPACMGPEWALPGTQGWNGSPSWAPVEDGRLSHCTAALLEPTM